MSQTIEGRKDNIKLKLFLVELVFIFAVGFSFFGIKKCVPYADSIEILAYRYLAAMIGVGVWFFVLKLIKKTPAKDKSRPYGRLYFTATFYILFMIFQIIAMFFASSIEGAIVYAMVPIFAKIIGRFALGEKSTVLQNVFMAITVAALVVLIILNATEISLNFTGIILMTVSSVCMAINNVSTRYIRGVFKPIEITRAIACGGFPIFATIAVVKAAMSGDVMSVFEPLKHTEFILWASFLGIFCILLSAQFVAFMLAHIQIVQMTAVNSMSTLVSIIAGVLILGEPLYWYHYLCGALIMVGVVGLAVAPAKKEFDGKSLGDDM
ncbi:MAG: DMT family transporter [Bacillota bacterium]|nr:DMT family transporter [Bacillota bacterium]